MSAGRNLTLPSAERADSSVEVRRDDIPLNEIGLFCDGLAQHLSLAPSERSGLARF